MPNPLTAISGLFSNLFKIFSGFKQNGANRSGVQSVKKISAAEKFPTFVVVPVDISLLKDGNSDSDEVERISTELAKRIKDALGRHFKNKIYNLVEIYALPSVGIEFNRYFNTTEALSDFQEICAEQIWPGRSDDSGQHVYFFRRSLKYDPVCEAKLGPSLIARPVGIGGETVASDPDIHSGESYQFLVGEIEVRDAKGVRIDKSPIRVWRQRADEHSYSLHVDFDVLSKAFEGKLHKMPLGIAFTCTTMTEGGERRIESVGMNVGEADKWSTFLGDFIQYLIYTGSGRSVSANDVRKIGDRTIPVDLLKDKDVTVVDAKTNTKITRQLTFHAEAKDGKSYRYVFRFFSRASKFDPKNNYLSLTGQLIRAGRTETVYTQPSFALKAEEIFSITEKAGSQGTFSVRAKDKRLVHRASAGPQDISPQGSFEAQVGDEIIYKPSIPMPGDINEFIFRLSSVAGQPQNVLQAGQYVGLIEINPGSESRSSQLTKDHYELGGGVFFAKDSGLNRRALIFERPYTQFIVKASQASPVWVVDQENYQFLDGKKVEDDGFPLELNGRYEIYVDRFRLELNLSTTPLNY